MPPDGMPLEVYVLPGESHLVSAPAILRTILGSCVGVTFRIPRLGVAAICHPMLPIHPAAGANKLSLASSRRYVDFTIRDLARQFDALGAKRGEIEVKLFGGGDVLMVTNEASRPTVGQLNCASALQVLEDEGFQVAASSLGGTSGLHIQFHTGTGEVLLKRLNLASKPCGVGPILSGQRCLKACVGGEQQRGGDCEHT